MNKLSFEIKQVTVSEGTSSKVIYDGIFYLVDDKPLMFENYNPADGYDIIESEEDWDFEGNSMRLLNHCTCGMWECDSIVACVIEKKDSITWKVHRLRYSEILAEYTFEKSQYQETIKEITEKVKDMYPGYLIVYWPNGDTYLTSFKSDDELIEYWNQKKDDNYEPLYIEDCKSRALFCCKDGKKISYSK